MQHVLTHMLMRVHMTMMVMMDVVRSHVVSVMLRLVMFRVLHMTTMSVMLLMPVMAVMTCVTRRVMGLEMTVMTVMFGVAVLRCR